MKHISDIILGFMVGAGIVFSILSCKRQEPTLYSDSDGGVYFNYPDEKDLQLKCNFADSLLTEPDYIDIKVRLKLLGRMPNDRLVVKLGASEVEGHPMTLFQELSEVVFDVGEYEKEMVIRVMRPPLEDSMYISDIIIESVNGMPNSGINMFEIFRIYSGTIFTKPAEWDSGASLYFGEWSKEKFKFLAKEVFKAIDFPGFGMDRLYSVHPDLVKSLRELGSEAEFEIPLYFNSQFNWKPYEKPPYWNDLLNRYIVDYDANVWDASSTFMQLANHEHLTTKTEEKYFVGDEDRVKEINASAFKFMQDYYNGLFLKETPIMAYGNQFQIPLFSDIDYDVIQPACWSVGHPETNSLLEKYYGSYSPDKLRFMIRTVVNKMPKRATLYFLFPVRIEWDVKEQQYHGSWDTYFTNMGEEIQGEQLAHALNGLFRAEDKENMYLFPQVDGLTVGMNTNK